MKKFTILTAFLLCSAWMVYGQWTYTNLSEQKAYMGATVLGSKAYFAGGYNNSSMLSTVEIYDFTTGEWDITNNLSVARELPFAVACASKVLFAGGADFYGSGAVYATVDIYDTIDQTWKVEQLSIPRLQAAVVSHGNKVLFAGGANLQQGVVYDIVDIYDIETGVWSTATLSEPRVVWWATVGDLAIFAGGYNLQTVSKRVDIYNFTTDTWSIDSLSDGRAFMTLTTIGSKVMIAGGMTAANVRSDVVDIYDAATGMWDTAYLSFPRAFCDNQNAVTVGGKAFFVGGGNINLNGAYWTAAYDVIDIYNETTNSWTVDTMPISLRVHHAVVADGNQIVIAGGYLMDPPYGYDSVVAIYTCPPSSCLPEGITFTTQEEIDNFQANHPGCTEIEGEVTINGSGITNLNGLNMITSIGGNLIIIKNDLLTNLTGLDALTYIGGYLEIGDVGDEGNPQLTSLTGLENLTSTGHGMTIRFNPVLTSFDGLEHLTSLGTDGFLLIQVNDALTDLTALSNLTTIRGSLRVEDNISLTSLAGFENINPQTIDNLFINRNPLLTSCEVESICSYLASPGGTVYIFDNAPGCEHPADIAVSCGTTFDCLPHGFYHFYSQSYIDNFHLGFPNCTVIEEYAVISGDDITNLNGLSQITSVNGDIRIEGNPLLTSLNGLNNLTTITGDLWVSDNAILPNLNGLNNLNSIGEELMIGYYPAGNPLLTSLSGLDNVEANSLNSILISDNASLSTCEVQSICDFLSLPNSDVTISNNATGCNNLQEVITACEAITIEEITIQNEVTIFPNPGNGLLSFSFPKEVTMDEVIIYNQTGQKILQVIPENNTLDVSKLQSGIYFIEIITDQSKTIQKLIIQ